MKANEIEAFLHEETERVKTEGQAWAFVSSGVPMQAFTNEAKDRMRVMAMVALIEEVQIEQIEPILRINFHSDARYGLQEGILWAIFMHSLSGLRRSDLINGLRQVAKLVSSYGNSFSSGPMRFQWPRPAKGEGIRRRTVETVQAALGDPPILAEPWGPREQDTEPPCAMAPDAHVSEVDSSPADPSRGDPSGGEAGEIDEQDTEPPDTEPPDTEPPNTPAPATECSNTDAPDVDASV